jgi:hypothetical protein
MPVDTLLTLAGVWTTLLAVSQWATVSSPKRVCRLALRRPPTALLSVLSAKPTTRS